MMNISDELISLQEWRNHSFILNSSMISEKNSSEQKHLQCPIIYTCDYCHHTIYENEERIRCLECENIDLCHDCYVSQKETRSHLKTHKVLIIPQNTTTIDITYSDESTCWDDEKDELLTESEEYDMNDVLNQLNTTKTAIQEEVTSIDSSLAMEILDAMCYFQFDFEGIASVLSKRISVDLIADYIYNIVLSCPIQQESSTKSSIQQSPIQRNEEQPKQYSWDYDLPIKKEDEILQETFSPTIIEYLVRDMTIESCDMEMIYCLKEIEPELHQITPLLIPSSQILYLLTLTMNKRYMEKLKLHVIHLQQERLFPNEKRFDEKLKRKLLQQYAKQTIYNLPSLEMQTKKRKSIKRKRQNQRQSHRQCHRQSQKRKTANN